MESVLKTPFTIFDGDVEAPVSEVSLNKKGGSVTATLKKAIVDAMPGLEGSTKLMATTLHGEGGQGLILMCPDRTDLDALVSVQRLAEHSYVLTLGAQEDRKLDAVSLAFLKLKEDEITFGRARLSKPVSGDEIRARKVL